MGTQLVLVLPLQGVSGGLQAHEPVQLLLVSVHTPPTQVYAQVPQGATVVVVDP